MTNPPKDRTWIARGSINHTTGEVAGPIYEDVLFSGIERFEHLPPLCQSDEVRADFERYKEWERMNAASAKD